MICLAAPAAAQHARLLSVFTWQEGMSDFGGISGLEMAADGGSLTAITDKGQILTAQVKRQKGLITDIHLTSFAPLLAGKEFDSEGLAIAPNNTAYISTEGPARVLTRRNANAPLTPLPIPEIFDTLQDNAALEALAIDARGRLYTLPERSGWHTRPFPVWRFDGAHWHLATRIARDPGLLPVGADFGPDGHLYVLERGFNGIGFRSRVRRFVPNTPDVQQGEVILATSILTHDNLEGLSIWQDAQGRLRLTMVSDDNFRRLQRTELVEYIIE